MRDATRLLREGLEALGVPDIAGCLPRLEGYMDELERWNPRFGLVNYDGRGELVVKHVLDSLSAWRVISERAAAGGGSILDVGSGAGLPGIPLAATLPDLSFTLVERMARRTAFLKTCCVLLGLSRVRVLTADLADVEGAFDVVTFRAVAPLGRFLADIRQSPVRWGTIAAYKGRKEKAEEEIDDVRRSGFRATLAPIATPFLDEERCLALVEHGTAAGAGV